MENNNIKDDELLNNLCKPIVQAITHGSRRCNLFSGNTIKRILELSPLCLQNEEVHITQSFKVTCLINNEYEKIFLKETLEKIKTADDENKPRIGYLAIGFISLNSNRVPAIIDKELKMLRRNVFEVCKDIFFRTVIKLPQISKKLMYVIFFLIFQILKQKHLSRFLCRTG